MNQDPHLDEPTDTILKPLSPLATTVEAASLEDLALFAIAVNRRTRLGDTLPSDLLTHDGAAPP